MKKGNIGVNYNFYLNNNTYYYSNKYRCLLDCFIVFININTSCNVF